jgi:hypothetical protein
MKNRVEFDAHKVLKQPVEVEVIKRDGTAVDFTARKEMKVPVHVRFKANAK